MSHKKCPHLVTKCLICFCYRRGSATPGLPEDKTPNRGRGYKSTMKTKNFWTTWWGTSRRFCHISAWFHGTRRTNRHHIKNKSSAHAQWISPRLCHRRHMQVTMSCHHQISTNWIGDGIPTVNISPVSTLSHFINDYYKPIQSNQESMCQSSQTTSETQPPMDKMYRLIQTGLKSCIHKSCM